MKYLKFYWSQKFLKYASRWQLGFFVLVPCMYLFSDILQWPHWATTITFQLIGAIIFFPIDMIILNKKNHE